MNYEKLVSRVALKGCKLDWTEEQFNEKYENTKSIIDIVSKCGHTVSVQCSNFLYKDTGVLCKSCISERNKVKTINVPTDNHIQEYNVIKALQSHCQNLKFKITNEGCLADIAIKPINEIDANIWLPIQIKTTRALSHGIYSFGVKNVYKDMFVLLFCIEDRRIWMINGNDISIKKINIGKTKSIYSKYEVSLQDIENHFISKYYAYKEYAKNIEFLDIPTSDHQKQEQEYYKFREQLFPSLSFYYPEANNRVFDCIINNVYKIQDKVITMFYKEQRENPLYIVHLSRKRKNANISYKLGDNDFYYFHLPDHKGAYIIPEKQLYDHDFISKADEDLVITSNLSLYPYHTKAQLRNVQNGWMNDYLYFYEHDGVKQKIMDLFQKKDRPNLVKDKYVCPIVIVDKEKPT